MKRVRCITNDEINLIGFLYECQSSTWNLLIPGVDGNIMTNEFIDVIGNNLEKNGQNFLCCHHRGSYQMISSNPKDPKIVGKTIGSMFERFDDCILDIKAWIEFAINSGAKKINLMAHSHGCNKLIYYLANEKDYIKYIDKLIFLSPLDLYTRMNNRRELKDLYNQADKIREEKDYCGFVCCGFFYKAAESFYDMMENPNINNFPMMSDISNDFTLFNSINKKKYIIYGSDEKKYTNKIEDKKQYLDKNICDIKIIDGASHIYQGKENELYDAIYEWIK